jgi:hypothetical protein
MKYVTSVILFISFIFCSFSQQTDCSCCSDVYEEFDFWLGSWEVINPDGTIAGTNTIDKIQDNCILRENWKSANGVYTGTSSNFYNNTSNKWEQIWIDNQGGSLYLKGNRIGNQMILQSDIQTNEKGASFYHRITWTYNNDGTVRQYWETFTNNDKVSVAFDGLYRKK